MSYDRQIDQVCPHEVIEESLFLGSDRRVVRPLRPIGSAASVRVRANSEVFVPSWGYMKPALAKGFKKGPFTIEPGYNELVIGMDGKPDRAIVLIPGSRIRQDDLVAQLNKSFKVPVFTTDKGRIYIRSESSGPNASLVLRPSSSAANTLGLSVNRYWRGITVYPGWSLVRDPRTLNDRPTRLIIFDKPLKGFQDYVELSYITIRQECRRCGGLGVENDWRYGRTGEVVQVRDEALLIQECLKMTYTVQGSNIFHSWYGTRVIDAIGKKQSSSGILQNMIVADIHEAFRKWQVVKKKQEEEVGQFVSDAEYPFRIVGISIEASNNDPTVVFVRATIHNRSQSPVVIDRGVKLPEPFDLSTFQQGAIRSTLTSYASATSR